MNTLTTSCHPPEQFLISLIQ